MQALTRLVQYSLVRFFYLVVTSGPARVCSFGLVNLFSKELDSGYQQC